jgi:hypothetical protein
MASFVYMSVPAIETVPTDSLNEKSRDPAFTILKRDSRIAESEIAFSVAVRTLGPRSPIFAHGLSPS